MCHDLFFLIPSSQWRKGVYQTISMLKPSEIVAAERDFFTVLAEHVSTLLWLFCIYIFPLLLVLFLLSWHLNGQLKIFL